MKKEDTGQARRFTQVFWSIDNKTAVNDDGESNSEFLKAFLPRLVLKKKNFCEQTFHISHVHISQKVKGALM